MSRLVAAQTSLRWHVYRFPIKEGGAPTTDSRPHLPPQPALNLDARGMKFILDGTPIERLSFLRDPYEDDPGNTGRPNFSDADIRAQFGRAVHGPAERRQILIHQTGDALADTVFAAQRGAGGSREFWRQRRPRLEHGFVLQPEQIAHAAAWGWTIVTNPIFYSLPDLWHARLGPVQESAVWPARTVLKSGAHLAIGSDAATVVPGPFVDLFFAQINPSNPLESISLQDAIVAYTKGSAYAEFKDQVKGSLVPLHAADLIVIDQDIFALGDHPENILNTKVLLTMVNGEVVHEVPRALKRN